MAVDMKNQAVQSWIQGVLDSFQRDAELTLSYCEDILEFGLEKQDAKLIGFAYYYIAQTYYGLNDGDLFLENITKALAYLEAAGEWELVARSYNVLGITAMNRGNEPVALDYYISGLDYCQKYDIPLVEVILNINCGVLNLQCGRFREAQHLLRRAYYYMRTILENADYHRFMVAIYQNLILCGIRQKKIEGIDDLLDVIHREHWEHMDTMDKVSLYSVEAIYYHYCQDEKRRDECIKWIDGAISENVILLDYFNDCYTYCELLLECGKDDEFWHVIEIVEPTVKRFNITYMQMRELALKIKFYRNHNQNAEYLQAAGLYYELSELREKETQKMMYSVLSLRRNLEDANEARKEAEVKNQILEEKSETDALTKLPNRFKLNDYSDKVLHRALENGQSFAIEILDIDYFKEYNDNYGHQAGDQVIISIANAIRDIAEEKGGFCARYGGDEFIIIYENVDTETVISYAKELKQSVMDMQIEHKYSKAMPIVTISQGLCCDIPQKEYRVWDYLHRADDMLYHIKKKCRNNYCVGDMVSEVREG